MLYYHSYQIKMLEISRQYPFGAEKAVQISQAVFFKNFDTKKAKSPSKIGYQIFFMNGSFGFKLLETFDIALRFMHTQLVILS